MNESITLKDIHQIARMAHQINKAYCEALGDFSQFEWHIAPQSVRDNVINGVVFHVEHPEAGPEASHENWMRDKFADGWRFGAEKNLDTRTHPNLVPFNDLAPAQRAKDSIFHAVVHQAVALVCKEESWEGGAP